MRLMFIYLIEGSFLAYINEINLPHCLSGVKSLPDPTGSHGKLSISSNIISIITSFLHVDAITTVTAPVTVASTVTTPVVTTSVSAIPSCTLFGSIFRPVPGTGCAQYTQANIRRVYTFTCPITLRFDTNVCYCNYASQFDCLV